MELSNKNLLLQRKYALTAFFYDILDYPWERQYRNWRPKLLAQVNGKVLEAGVGTGRNFAYYHKDVDLTGIELSPAMLTKAKKRAAKAACKINLILEDATTMQSIADNQFDWLVSTFMCCVMPDELQPAAIQQFQRVLKPGGKFLLLEMVYSNNPKLRKRQQRFAPFVEKVYGARFDRQTLKYLTENPHIEITNTQFLKADTYMLIQGLKKYPE